MLWYIKNCLKRFLIYHFLGCDYLNIAICDDDKLFCDYLEDQCRNYYDERKVPLNIFKYTSGESLLDETLLFDLVFLDVEMGVVNGIETGKELHRKNPHSIIIVVTSYDCYLDDAFRIQAFRFLSKPIDLLRFNRTLDDVSDLIKNDIIIFYDVQSAQNTRIYANDIIYLEIAKKKTKVVTVNGTYYSRERMSYWKSKLNGISFVSPHSSYLVNLDYSINHSRTRLVLANKDSNGKIIERYEISIAPKKQNEIKRMFFYLLERR